MGIDLANGTKRPKTGFPLLGCGILFILQDQLNSDEKKVFRDHSDLKGETALMICNLFFKHFFSFVVIYKNNCEIAEISLYKANESKNPSSINEVCEHFL